MRTLIDRQSSVSIRAQCQLLGIHRSGTYYRPVGETEENLLLMRLLDERCLNFPTEGILQLQDYLREAGYTVNHKRVRRLARKMGLMAIYRHGPPRQTVVELVRESQIHSSLAALESDY